MVHQSSATAGHSLCTIFVVSRAVQLPCAGFMGLDVYFTLGTKLEKYHFSSLISQTGFDLEKQLQTVQRVRVAMVVQTTGLFSQYDIL